MTPGSLDIVVRFTAACEEAIEGFRALQRRLEGLGPHILVQFGPVALPREARLHLRRRERAVARSRRNTSNRRRHPHGRR
ncbi:hypothetical protein [Patulibacter sp. SYSU D01012]|uniref:hypothetical protein n=1 Tax=Patulibacter sp. SYSU D01012 TaxID=2817381 RepID=UPI001B311FF4|nr:hypothetical protein [Patulibacter sp. SYSU D01012]